MARVLGAIKNNVLITLTIMIVGKVHEIGDLFYGFDCSDCAYYPTRIFRSLLF